MIELAAVEMSAPGGAKKKTVKEWKAEQDIISFAEFEKMIPDEAAAVAFMEEKRWGQTPRCPRCGTDAVYRVKSGRLHRIGVGLAENTSMSAPTPSSATPSSRSGRG